MSDWQDRQDNAERYDRLAEMMEKVGNGPEDMDYDAIRDSMAASHILDREGDIDHERLDNWMYNHGFEDPYSWGEDADEIWDEVADRDTGDAE